MNTSYEKTVTFNPIRLYVCSDCGEACDTIHAKAWDWGLGSYCAPCGRWHVRKEIEAMRSVRS